MQHLERKHLTTFAVIAKTGSLTKAAEQLFISQSALSHQIKKLEHNLNCQLLQRLPQGIVLTEQGKAIAEKAASLLPQFEQLEQQLIANAKQQLTIAMPCYYCFQWLMPVLQQLEQSYHYQIALYDEVFEQQPNCDLLFVDEKLSVSSGYQALHIGEFEMQIVAAKAHKIHQTQLRSITELVDETWLSYPLAENDADLYQLLFKNSEIKPKKVIKVQNSLQLLQQVAAGMGLAFVPNWLVTSLSMQAYIKPVQIRQNCYPKSLWLYVATGQLSSSIIAQLHHDITALFSKLNKG